MLDASLLPLDADRARLRALRQGDAEAFAEGSKDPQVRGYGHLPEPDYTPASVVLMIDTQAEPGLRRGDLAVLAIADPYPGDGFAGSLVLFDVTDQDAEVGFWLHPKCRGGGMAAAALDLAAEFARGSGLVRLRARTSSENVASQRVLAGAGFTETARDVGTAPSGKELPLIHYQRNLRLP